MRGHAVRGLDRPAVLAVFSLALLARLWQLVRWERQGLGEGYDPSAYYTAAVALLHGRLPYHGDFTFLHPPGIVLAGLPTAVLGELTTAHVGYVAAHVLACVLGAAACAGVSVIAGQWDLPRGPALLGGLFLAVWPTAVTAQASFRLEPLGDVLLVVVLIVLGPGPEVATRRLVVAGIALGVLVNVKVWWFLPVLVLLVLTGVRLRSWAAPLLVSAAAALTAAVIDLPFLLAPGSRMFRSVVVAQLQRPAVQSTPTGLRERWSTLVRLDQLSGVSAAAGRFLTPAETFTDPRVRALAILVCLVFLGLGVLALRTALGRLASALLAAQVAAVLASPLYFAFYGDFVGVAAALVLAAGASVVPRATPWLVAVPLAAALGLALALTTATTPTSVDQDRIAAAVGDARCIVSDSPRVLIALDALDRSLSRGCPNWVDVQGVGHGGGPDPRARLTGDPRAAASWRRQAVRYFESGDALLLSDPNIGYWLGARARAQLTRDRRATRVGGVTVYGPPPVR